MNLPVTILTLLWIVRLGANLLSYIHLWFIKEYRFDRMIIHLQTGQGKRILFPPFKTPPLSPKTISLFILTVATAVVFVFVLPFPWLVRMALADIFLFVIVSFFVGVLKLPTYLYHWYLIRKAVRKLEHHAPMIVVGITGSYGKTSTKEILYTLLSTKYKTMKTEASKNSPIAIAEAVLVNLQPDTEALIVEMGAYKRGEIAFMCEMVKPQIGIVTAINEQHQDLFGTIENTMRAKYELIEGLSGKRIGIFNADDPKVREMATWAKKDGATVRFYSIRQTKRVTGYITVSAHDARQTHDGIEFFAWHNTIKKYVHVRLFGVHQAANILAAMAAAISCGMPFDQIVKSLGRIGPIAGVMNKVEGPNGSVVIDDTFNNNPDAARAAIDFLASRPGGKILVFQPMIELGREATRLHREFGARAGPVCDELILTNDSFADAIQEGVRSVGSSTAVRVMDARSAVRHLAESVKKGDTIFFKGKESARTLRLITSQDI